MIDMKEYVYPAVFHRNDDNTYTILFPDLPGCISEGKDLGNAMYMAQSALTQWIEYLSDKKKEIPVASELSSIKTEDGEFANFVRADVKSGKAVRRTVSIPQWMDEEVADAGLSLSMVLQEALAVRLRPSR